MIRFFETTTLILFWCFVFSLLWSYWVYHFCDERQSRGNVQRNTHQIGMQTLILPGIVLGSLLVFLFYHFFAISLIYPVHFDASFLDLNIAALAPGFVLFIASGLFLNIKQLVSLEFQFWFSKSFTRFYQASGLSPKKKLRKLVLLKSMTASWSWALPWIFGELIIVEKVFNAPGIALEAWHQARSENMVMLAQAIWGLSGLYVGMFLVNLTISSWVGRKLESY